MSDRKIVTGNAIEEGKDKRGWFVGGFIDSEKELQSTSDLEVKWGFHLKGEERESKAGEGIATTLSILIRGNFKIIFEDQEINLNKEGDYAMCNPNLPHSTVTLEDSLVITVRWPSLPTKQN